MIYSSQTYASIHIFIILQTKISGGGTEGPFVSVNNWVIHCNNEKNTATKNPAKFWAKLHDIFFSCFHCLLDVRDPDRQFLLWSGRGATIWFMRPILVTDDIQVGQGPGTTLC